MFECVGVRGGKATPTTKARIFLVTVSCALIETGRSFAEPTNCSFGIYLSSVGGSVSVFKSAKRQKSLTNKNFTHSFIRLVTHLDRTQLIPTQKCIMDNEFK